MNASATHSEEKNRRIRLKAWARCAMPGHFPCLVISALLVSLADLFLSESVPLGSTSVSGTLIYYIITGIIFLVISILKAGLCRQSLLISREQMPAYSDILFAFRNHPDNLILAFLHMIPAVIMGGIVPFVIFLLRGLIISPENTWPFIALSLFILLLAGCMIWLFLIPFSMVTWLYLDKPSAAPRWYLNESLRLMKGQVRFYLKLNLSFAGLYALSLLSLGLAMPWVGAYRRCVLAHFYLDRCRRCGVYETL